MTTIAVAIFERAITVWGANQKRTYLQNLYKKLRATTFANTKLEEHQLYGKQ